MAKNLKNCYSQTPLFRAPLFRDPPYFAVFEGQIFHPDLLQSHRFPTSFRLFLGTFMTSNMVFDS